MGDKEKLQQAQEMQRELNDQRLSRRAFLDRLKVLGVGFGAAAMLGVRDADPDIRSDASATSAMKNSTRCPDARFRACDGGALTLVGARAS